MLPRAERRDMSIFTSLIWRSVVATEASTSSSCCSQEERQPRERVVVASEREASELLRPASPGAMVEASSPTTELSLSGMQWTSLSLHAFAAAHSSVAPSAALRQCGQVGHPQRFLSSDTTRRKALDSCLCVRTCFCRSSIIWWCICVVGDSGSSSASLMEGELPPLTVGLRGGEVSPPSSSRSRSMRRPVSLLVRSSSCRRRRTMSLEQRSHAVLRSADLRPDAAPRQGATALTALLSAPPELAIEERSRFREPRLASEAGTPIFCSHREHIWATFEEALHGSAPKPFPASPAFAHSAASRCGAGAARCHAPCGEVAARLSASPSELRLEGTLEATREGGPLAVKASVSVEGLLRSIAAM
mmetsp:Transcript_30640/g.90919  ORF Transcript_30640/g.90919 Transcript_30640/m.90919 type:complete len:361 (+) Transcript_30640:818-1900(+)